MRVEKRIGHARFGYPVRSTTVILRRGSDLCAGNPRARIAVGKPPGFATQPKGSLMTKSSPAVVVPAFAADALLDGSAVQFRLRNGGSGTAGSSAYIQACRALGAWGRGAGQANLVHALVHLGWASTSGARKTVQSAKSAAWVDHAVHVLTVGDNAAEALAGVVTALAEAGAPAELLEVVWATFTAEAA